MICYSVLSYYRDFYQIFLFTIYQTYSMHDYSRDIMLATAQENIELRMLLSAAGNKKLEIEESMKKLEEVSKKTGEILSQMLPKSVAERLRLDFYTSHILGQITINGLFISLNIYCILLLIEKANIPWILVRFSLLQQCYFRISLILIQFALDLSLHKCLSS